MNDGFAWWLGIAGIGIGVGLAWLLMGRLPRSDDDIDDTERAAEAAWISRSIGEYGGVAPQPLVEEVLELHRHYLAGPGLALAAGRSEGSEAVDADADEDASLWADTPVEAPPRGAPGLNEPT